MIVMDLGQKEIMTKIIAITVSELNKKIPGSFVSGLRIGVTRNKGHAHYLKNRITIPIWVLKRSIHYIRYYICHEIAHLVTYRIYGRNEKHNSNFKEIERQFCAAFGVRLAFPERYHNRAYPIAICGPDGFFERN